MKWKQSWYRAQLWFLKKESEDDGKEQEDENP